MLKQLFTVVREHGRAPHRDRRDQDPARRRGIEPLINRLEDAKTENC